MGKEKEKDKDKDKKDKDKEKNKKDKDKKDKDKKDKDKKDKDKDKDKEEKDDALSDDWKLQVSKNLDNLVIAYESIANKFRDIDNYVLKEVATRKEFTDKVKSLVKDLPDATQQIFIAFLDALP